MREQLILILEQILSYVLQNGMNAEEEQMLMELLQAIVDWGQQEEEPLGDGEPPDIQQGQYPSSNIEGFNYDPRSGNLLIQFHGPYPQAKGPIYSYDGVPEFIFKLLQSGRVGPLTSGKNRYHRWFKGVTPSLGAAVHALIKMGGYNYKKVA